MGEFADLETLCQQGYTDNLPQILGILYRPIVEEYGDFYRIENYDGEDRSEYFKQAPASVAVSASAFFEYRGEVGSRFSQLFRSDKDGGEIGAQ